MGLRASPADEAFRMLRAGSCVLHVDREFEDAVARLRLLERGRLERLLAEAAGPTGRAATAVLALPGRSERLHLRAARHGGWLAGLWGGRVAGTGRALRELAVTAELRARGAPVPRPVLVVARRVAGPLHQVALGTLYAESSCDAIAFLSGTPAPERVLAACRAAGQAVRELHRAGGRHPDLHVGNLLLRDSGEDVVCLVVDLDRAHAAAPPAPSRRMTELGRLHRSLVRRGLHERVGSAGREAFLDAYVDGDTELRRDLQRFLPRERRRLARRQATPGWGASP